MYFIIIVFLNYTALNITIHLCTTPFNPIHHHPTPCTPTPHHIPLYITIHPRAITPCTPVYIIIHSCQHPYIIPCTPTPPLRECMVMYKGVWWGIEVHGVKLPQKVCATLLKATHNCSSGHDKKTYNNLTRAQKWSSLYP